MKTNSTSKEKERLKENEIKQAKDLLKQLDELFGSPRQYRRLKLSNGRTLLDFEELTGTNYALVIDKKVFVSPAVFSLIVDDDSLYKTILNQLQFVTYQEYQKLKNNLIETDGK